jgi:uncharacterized repeat protein (TIGR02543 family)
MALPAAGSAFTGWGGACTGTAATCTVDMTAARDVTATFAPAVPPPAFSRLTVQLTGLVSGASGEVESSPDGIECELPSKGKAREVTCSARYASTAKVRLTAEAESGSAFVGWGGACTGTARTCTVSMTGARTVTATFTRSPELRVKVEKARAASSGKVGSEPAGLSCATAASGSGDTTCKKDFAAGTQMRITASPAPGTTFAGWGGACAGKARTCTVSMSEARSVTARFD